MRCIDGKGFDIFSQNYADELVKDIAFSDEDIIAMTLVIAEDPENGSEAEEKPVLFTASIIRQFWTLILIL